MHFFRKGSWLVVIWLLAGCVRVSDDPRTNDEKAEDYVRIGTQYYQLGQMERALENLKKAVRFNPQSYPGHAMLAIVYEQLNRTQTAEEHYGAAVDLVSKDSHEYGAIHNNYGAFLCSQGRVNDAEREFQLAMANRLYRTPEAAYENGGLCVMRHGNYEKAENYFRNALKLKPVMPRSLLAMAQLTFESERFLPARGYIQRYHDASEPTAASLSLGIKIESALGDDEAVRALTTQLQQKFPNSNEARLVGRRQ